MKNLKEWREHRNLSREDLAERAGFPVEAIERWEEVGFDVEPGSRSGDVVVNRLMNVLDAGEGMRTEYMPDSPKPGDLVITPGEGAGVEDLIERAEELNVRISVPDRFGLSLKPLKEVSGEDYAAIARYFEGERAYSEAVVRRMEGVLEMLGADSGDWREGQTMGERLEEAGREMEEDLDGLDETLDGEGRE